MDNKAAAIIGVGELGGALGVVLAKTGRAVRSWDKDPAKLEKEETLSLPETVRGASVVFFCVPSWAMREALLSVNPYLEPDAVAVSLAKGLEPDSGQTMAELYSKIMPKKRAWAVMSGPMLAEELRVWLPAAAVVASTDKTTAKRVAQLFKGTRVACVISADPAGTALAGVLKNIYALGLGIAEGLDWGDNGRGWLIGLALEEMERIGKLWPVGRDIFLSPAGLGDLVATGMSAYSSNHDLGRALAKRETIRKPSEGYLSIGPLGERLGESIVKLKFLQAIHQIVIAEADPKVALEELLA